jgi:chromosome segregation ATPase
MAEVEEYRIKIEAIQERLKSSNGEGEDEVQDLKDRLGSVRDAMQRKQETIDSQNSEIAALREESGQLSDMLGQALAALEVQTQGGIKEIVESIDSEFADLLADSEAQPEQTDADDDGGRREPAIAEADSQEAENQEASSEGPKWDPENESAPALQRIMGRKKR